MAAAITRQAGVQQTPFLQPRDVPFGQLRAPAPRILQFSADDASTSRTWRQSAIPRAVRGGGAAAELTPKPKSLAGRLKEPQLKEAHKVFDEVVIVVKAGDGGQGEFVETGKGKWVNNLKYRPGGNQPKRLWLPASAPGDGADGADVVLVCDPSYDTLLHLHGRKQYAAPRGANANPAAGSSGPKNNKEIKKAVTPPFEIPVPPGTVVKRKGTGTLLGELLNPGDRLVVARGGRGGCGVVVPSREQKERRRASALKRAEAQGAEVVEVQDTNWKADAAGAPGQQLSLQLLLRVVADVGIVGFPNAGKSSLLRAMTNASPDIAPYPFTTLMPNLGVLGAGGPERTVLADLPGLIEGAHTGRGLGRMFLRHLRRTRVVLHVLDAAAPDPPSDYVAVREELRMYNPAYCARPHVVALNKLDLMEGGATAVAALARRVLEAAAEHCAQWAKEEVAPLPPAAIVGTSAADGSGLAELNTALSAALSPGCAKGLASRGVAATSLLLPSATQPPGKGPHAPGEARSPQPTIQRQFFNSKLQGQEAAGATSSGAGSQGRHQDTSGGTAGDVDPEDEQWAWMLDLSDSQLLRIVETDEKRAVARAAAAAAAGADAWGSVRPEDVLPPTYAAQYGTPTPDAATAAGESTDSASPSARVLDFDSASSPQGPLAGSGNDEGDGGEEEEEDEWVELSEEELELLAFLDAHEEAEAAAAAAAGVVGGRDGGGGADPAHGALTPQEAAMMSLNDEALEALADGGDAAAAAWDSSTPPAAHQPVVAAAAESGDKVDPADAWLFELDDAALEALAERGEASWQQRVDSQP